MILVPRPYPVQENVGVAVLPQRPIGEFFVLFLTVTRLISHVFPMIMKILS